MRTLLFVGVVAVAGCSGPGGTCTPGASSACTCTNGAMGAQTCLPNGTFDACVCSGGAGGGAGGGDKRVFVTITAYDGNLGGLSGADAKCQTAADGANLGGTWKAWLSTSSANARDRVGAGPWSRLGDKARVFNNKQNLETQPLEAITVTEQGSSITGSFDVWTGTLSGGMSSGTHCNNWMNNVVIGMGNNAFGTVGNATNTAAWTDDGTIGNGCDSRRRLYCFEQ